MAAQQSIPSRLRKSGGPGGSGKSFQYDWRGGRVQAAILADQAEAMAAQQARILGRLQNELHRYPGHSVHQLAPGAFARVEVRAGRRTLVAGSTAPFTEYHELGTSTFVGHPQIRQIMDQEIPRILPRIRAASSRHTR